VQRAVQPPPANTGANRAHESSGGSGMVPGCPPDPEAPAADPSPERPAAPPAEESSTPASPWAPADLPSPPHATQSRTAHDAPRAREPNPRDRMIPDDTPPSPAPIPLPAALSSHSCATVGRCSRSPARATMVTDFRGVPGKPDRYDEMLSTSTERELMPVHTSATSHGKSSSPACSDHNSSLDNGATVRSLTVLLGSAVHRATRTYFSS
jgi:hypothetical protein